MSSPRPRCNRCLFHLPDSDITVYGLDDNWVLAPCHLGRAVDPLSRRAVTVVPVLRALDRDIEITVDLEVLAAVTRVGDGQIEVHRGVGRHKKFAVAAADMTPWSEASNWLRDLLGLDLPPFLIQAGVLMVPGLCYNICRKTTNSRRAVNKRIDGRTHSEGAHV
jgi:hypothetical protein